MNILRVFLIAGLTLAPIETNAEPAKMALLPFMADDDSSPHEGWSLAVKYLERIPENIEIQAVSWKELDELMEKEQIKRNQLGQLKNLRRIGQTLGVDAVVTGEFVTENSQYVARPLLVQVASGAVRRGKPWKSEKDLLVAAPENLSVDAPVLDDEDALDLRYSVSDTVCDGAGKRVDGFESRILDLKARYWALQLKKGVAMSGLKFNPGSTISNPELKMQFYGRIKTWYAQEIIPELTPTELKVFAEIDEQAFQLARRCAIL